MKTLTVQILKAALLATIIVVGISYIYAWTSPGEFPTDGNTPAPIDVGASTQTKVGSLDLIQNLTVAGNVTVDLTSGGSLIIQDGNEGAGKVLTSDANGNAYWK